MSDKITVRDEKLLRREGYIRRERYVCLGLSIMTVLGFVIEYFVVQDRAMAEITINGGVIAILCLLGYAYYCTLLIRHIETIKHCHSKREPQ
jgi:hypothetical protein